MYRTERHLASKHTNAAGMKKPRMLVKELIPRGLVSPHTDFTRISKAKVPEVPVPLTPVPLTPVPSATRPPVRAFDDRAVKEALLGAMHEIGTRHTRDTEEGCWSLDRPLRDWKGVTIRGSVVRVDFNELPGAQGLLPRVLDNQPNLEVILSPGVSKPHASRVPVVGGLPISTLETGVSVARLKMRRL